MSMTPSESADVIWYSAELQSTLLSWLPVSHCYLFTSINPDRAHACNQDAVLGLRVDAERAVLAVADGFGGCRSGEVAARIAVEELRSAVYEAANRGELREAILNGFERANERVLALGVGAAATLVVAELLNASIRTYHVGDSAALVVGQRGKVKLLTVAHSPVGYAVESGVLDAAEAMFHDDRHVVSNMIGSTDMRIEVGTIRPLLPRDTVVLGSDGLFDNLHTDEIVSIVRAGELQKCADKLATTASARMKETDSQVPGKPDDLTFVLFRNGQQQQRGAHS